LVASLAILVLTVMLTRPPENVPEPTRDLSRFVSADLPIDQGLALVVFLSTDCGHCDIVATMLSEFDAKAHGLGVYFMLYGRPEEAQPFLARTGMLDVPHRMLTAEEYAEYTSQDPPQLYLLRNGKLEVEWPGARFSLQGLQDAIAALE
jgi:hypothetical protein